MSIELCQILETKTVETNLFKTCFVVGPYNAIKTQLIKILIL